MSNPNRDELRWPIDRPTTFAWLKLFASGQVAAHPQYANHFESYLLGRIKRDIKTKMGLAFTRGEYVLAVKSPAVVHLGVVEIEARVTAWSRRNAVDTSVRDQDIEWLEV